MTVYREGSQQIIITKEKGMAKEKIPSGTIVMCDDGEEREVITREEAIEAGSNRYFTGIKCRNGHMAERKVKGYVCTTCARLRAKARRKERLATDPEYKERLAAKRREKHKKRYHEDPEYRAKVLAKAKERRLRKKAGREAAQEELKEEAA